MVQKIDLARTEVALHDVQNHFQEINQKLEIEREYLSDAMIAGMLG